MQKSYFSINDKEVPNLIRKLRRFLDPKSVDNVLDKYRLSLESSGQIYADFYLSKRHPWWNAIIYFNELDKLGKSIRKNLTDEIVSLASDAKKITTLQKIMPEDIKNKYRQNLLSERNCRGFLFEIDIAWHYFLKQYRIEWYKSNTDNHPEFRILSPQLDFDVECKTIGIDTFRKIRRRDFYFLMDILIPKIQKMKLTGELRLTFKDRMPQNTSKLYIISDEVIKRLETNNKIVDTSFGVMGLELFNNNDRPVDLVKMQYNLNQRKSPHAHALIIAGDLNDKPVNPIEIICDCEKAVDLLKGIRKKLGKAVRNQLSSERPGFLACFIPEIEDFAGLEIDSGLANMTFDLFCKEKERKRHLAAISYSSDERFSPTIYGKTSKHPGLLFRNPYCQFTESSKFDFIDLKN